MLLHSSFCNLSNVLYKLKLISHILTLVSFTFHSQLQGTIHKFSRTFSVSTTCNERFGTSKGESGWKWDKGGVGMGGKETGM